MPDYIQVLADELTNDPLGRGYAGMSDEQAATDLNDPYRTQSRDTLPSAAIYEATDVAEFQALSDLQKQYVRDIWSLGDNVLIGPGTKARAVYVQLFDAESETRTALLAAATQAIARATELGLGTVKVGHVQMARSVS